MLGMFLSLAFLQMAMLPASSDGLKAADSNFCSLLV